MNELILTNTGLPVVCAIDSRTAAEPFFHADRVLDFNVLIYVTEGVIYVTEDGTDYEIPDGSLLFLKSGLRHFGRTEIPKGTRWVFVHFFLPENSLPPLSRDTSDIGVHEPLRSSVTVPKQLFSLRGTPLERRITDLDAFSHSRDSSKRFRLNLMLSELLTEAALSGSLELTLADRIAEFLTRSIGEPFSAKKLEQHFYLSYKRLAAVFKEQKGLSMQQFHSGLRLSEAARLLRTTALPVSEIAGRTGFSDPLYFSRCFRSAYSLSPKAYRRRMSGRY